MLKQRALSTTLLTALAVGAAGAAQAQVDEIVVTATKTEATAQSIPVAVDALGAQSLEELDVDVFTDYLQELPGVTAGGSGPGQNTIYIRGLASTTPNLTTAGVAGLAPNVAFYLDEQPLAQPGRNLDVYAADLERVEVLPGPQGTLYGASSQAGTVRMITNKPVVGAFEASSSFGVSFTENGEMSNKVEAMVNLPVTDNFALRGVVYVDNQGGYIDNIGGTRTARDSARFRNAGTVRANGVPVSDVRGGIQASDSTDLSNVQFRVADNYALVEEDFNDTTYQGFRLSGRYEFNADWRLTVAHARQALDSEGVFFSDPTLSEDLAIQRFSEDDLQDDFHNTSWTLEGRLGMLDLVYTGAYTDRDTNQIIGYSDYLFVGQFLPDYICDYNVVYPGYAGLPAPVGVCQEPNLFVKSLTETQVQTHEFRFNTPQDRRFRVTAGAFFSDLTLNERNDYTYPGSKEIVNANGTIGIQSLAPNFPLTNADATPGQQGNETQGFFTDPGPFPAGVGFRNDIQRTDEQLGVFGEATFDLVPNTFSVTVGARWYDIEVDLKGSANSSFDVLFAGTAPDGSPVDAQAFGTNISAQFSGNSPTGAPDKAATDGTIFKVTGTWTPTADLLFYATWSEGFRPGILNRPGGATQGDFTVPFALDTDDVTNWELGWKTDLFDNQLRFNGNAFFVEIERLQTTIFDPSITNLFFSDNAANAEIRGVEGDITWAPADIPGLTVTGAFSLLDTEITEVLTPTNDVIEGEPLAFAPEYQGNIYARYEWTIEGGPLDGKLAHVQPQLVFSAESFSDIIEINKIQLDSYAMADFAVGVSEDRWSIEGYVNNLTDERAELSNDFVFDRERVTYARPRTWGVRVNVTY